MKLKKLQLEPLFNLAKGTESTLSLAESRIRDSFIKPLSEIVQTYYDDRNVIYKIFCLKTEDGESDLLDGDKYQFPKGELDKINKELQILADEEVEVNFPDSVKDILEKSDYKPKIGEAEIIDEILSKI